MGPGSGRVVEADSDLLTSEALAVYISASLGRQWTHRVLSCSEIGVLQPMHLSFLTANIMIPEQRINISQTCT